MTFSHPKRTWLIIFALIAYLSSKPALAQEDTVPKKKLISPATVKGNIGGESHDSYVIQATKGKLMTVEISWKKDGENGASFSISESPNFFTGGLIQFGKESENGKRWVGRIPKTGKYYIYVVASPIADYTLKVTLK